MIFTITPDVKDRTRLITQANLFSGFVEKIPTDNGPMNDWSIIMMSNPNAFTLCYSGIFTVSVMECWLYSLCCKGKSHASIETPALDVSDHYHKQADFALT
jgi:hypothetical protein